MDLFIETEESRAKRLAHVVGEAAGPLFTPPETPRQSNEPSGDKRPQSVRGERPDRSYSLEQEAYREELAFDRCRQRRRRVLAAVRLLAAVVLVPIALIALFIASYALTCIASGATPAEVGELLHDLFYSVATALQACASQVMQSVSLKY